MCTHAELAARLLNECARFFRSIDGPEGAEGSDFETLAETCEAVAELVVRDPQGELSLDSFN